MRLFGSFLKARASKAYAGWREESSAVRASYESWRDAHGDVKEFAWAAYLDALDREERAADEYRECADRFAPA